MYLGGGWRPDPANRTPSGNATPLGSQQWRYGGGEDVAAAAAYGLAAASGDSTPDGTRGSSLCDGDGWEGGQVNHCNHGNWDRTRLFQCAPAQAHAVGKSIIGFGSKQPMTL